MATVYWYVIIRLNNLLWISLFRTTKYVRLQQSTELRKVASTTSTLEEPIEGD